ncbi:MAG: hypothetical protein NTW59_00325, partial [Candidatus Diapherotrites archaeon]|nr:hypothetical protein [Candidatus Diapherotrites archaeon]
MAARKFPRNALNAKNSLTRQRLAEAAAFVRKADAGQAERPYNLDRALREAPFYNALQQSLQRRLAASSGKILALDKGAGTGRAGADLKGIAPDRIIVEALSLSRTIAPEYRAVIDKAKRAFGITTKHERKFHMICDLYGEDYHLPKGLVRHSIAKAISDLEKGGELFTVIPLLYRENPDNLTVDEGRALVAELSQRKGLTVRPTEVQRRFDRR